MSASVFRQIPASATEATTDSGAADAASIDLLRRGDVLVIRPLGALERSALPRLRRLVLGADRPVILDLDECVLVDPRMLAAADFESDDAVAHEIRIVSRRFSCRRLLARVGVSDRFCVHATLEDAIHAMRGSLRTGVSVSTTDDGRHVASLEATGHVCTATAALLEEEISRLIEDGVAELTVELGHVDTCAGSVSTALQSTVRDEPVPCASASDLVDRVLAVMDGADPSFCQRIAIDGDVEGSSTIP